MTRTTKQKLGFTLVEMAATVVILVIAMGLAMAGFMYSFKNVNRGDIQNELDVDVQLAMERLKIDLRLSSLDDMFYYPAGAGPYEAISFPLAEDLDGDGLYEKDDEGKINWTETVIYHVRPTTPNQLVKTVFKPRDNSLTDAQRQAQIEEVVKYGSGDYTYNGSNAKSYVIFENLLHWNIIPKEGRFDAYSPILTRDIARLGYALLDPGEHKFEFRIIGKNGRSSGYNLGIDQLVVSPSYGEREGEAQLPATDQVGATASSQYMIAGSWKGNHHLYFPATKVGSALTLTLDNDRWEETNFDGVGYTTENTVPFFNKSLSPKDFVVTLSGNEITWNAADRSGSAGTSTGADDLRGAKVDLLLRGSDLLEPGVESAPRCKFTIQAGKLGQLRIDSMVFGESVNSDPTSVDFNRTSSTTVKDSGGDPSWEIDSGTAETSQWVDYEIVKTNNYVLTYKVKNDGNSGCANLWTDSSPNYRITLASGSAYTNAFILCLAAVTPSYPKEGTYTSQIFDTHVDSPNYKGISWNSSVPSGTSLGMKVRTGDKPDLSDAADWSTISASSLFTASNKRYVQFQAVMEANSANDQTPRLDDVTINWTGEKRLVDIGGIFTKGPDYGTFEIRIDGEPLRSAIIADLEIYKDVVGINKATQRYTSTLQTELTPRNSGL